MAFPMIGTTALSLAFALPKAIIMIAIPSIIMNIIVLFSNNKNGIVQEIIFYFRNYWLLVIATIIGSIIGIKLLLVLPVGIMYLVMSIVTLAYVSNEILSEKGLIKPIKFSTNIFSTIIFGILAGIIGGATNAMSPILMMYLFSKTTNKHEIVKSSNICYFFGKVIQLFLLGNQIDKINDKEIIFILCITVVSIIFLFIGIKFRNKVSNRFFKNTIYIILILLGVKVGYSGIVTLP